MKLHVGVFVAGVLLCSAGISAEAADINECISATWPKDAIHGLKLQMPSGQTKEQSSFISISGFFVREDWTLLLEKSTIPLDKDGKFNLEVPLSGPRQIIVLDAVGPQGALETLNVEVLAPCYAVAAAKTDVDSGSPALPFSLGAGTSLISYQQASIVDFSETAITLKVAYTRPLFSPKFELNLSAYFTAAAIGQSQDATARFLGLNGRVGYVIPSIPEPWRVLILGGWYYTTMFVTDNLFGFRNLMGPQLYPTVQRTLTARDSVGAYFKFSPVADGISPLSLSNRELAAGIAYSRKLANEKRVSVSLDAARLDLDVQSVVIRSQSLSLGVGYSL
jgi:hypothetical protein